MNTGCPRAPVHDAALQLLQLLDQRFFGNVGPLPATELETGECDSSLQYTIVCIFLLSLVTRLFNYLHSKVNISFYYDLSL